MDVSLVMTRTRRRSSLASASASASDADGSMVVEPLGRESLAGMSRAEVQAIAKKFGVKANLKTSEIEAALRAMGALQPTVMSATENVPTEADKPTAAATKTTKTTNAKRKGLSVVDTNVVASNSAAPSAPPPVVDSTQETKEEPKPKKTNVQAYLATLAQIQTLLDEQARLRALVDRIRAERAALAASATD